MLYDWWDLSKRLRRFLYSSPSIYGFKCVQECGNWKILIIRKIANQSLQPSAKSRAG